MEAALPAVSRRVQVRLIQGVNLLGVNDFPKGLSDPVCTITNRRTGEKLMSRQLDNTVNPRWHQSLFLEDVQPDDILDVCMWSTHVLSRRSSLIGQTEISVNVALRRSSDVLFHPVPWPTGHDENLLAVLNRLALGNTSSSTAWTPDASPHQALMAAPWAMPLHFVPPQTRTGVKLQAPSQVGRPHESLEQPTCQSFLEQDRKMPLRIQAHQEDSGHQVVQQHQQNLQQDKQLQQQLQQIEQLQQIQNLECLHQQFEKQQLQDQRDLAQQQTSALLQQNTHYHQQPSSQVDSYVHDPTQYPPIPPSQHYPPYQNPLPAPSVRSYVQSAQPYQSLLVNDPNLADAAQPVFTSNMIQQRYPFSSFPQSGHMQSNFPGELPIPYITASLPPSSSEYSEPLPPSFPLLSGYPRPMSTSGKPACAAMSSTSVTNGVKPPLCGVNPEPHPLSLEPSVPHYPEIPPPPAQVVPCSLPTPSAPSYNGSLYPPSIPGTVPPPAFNSPDYCPQPPSYVFQCPLGIAQEELSGQALMSDQRNDLHSNQCSGDGNFAFCSNGKDSGRCLHTSGAHGPSLQSSCAQESDFFLYDAPPLFKHGATKSDIEDISYSSSTALLCPEAVSLPYGSSPPRLVLRPNASTEIGTPALEGAADCPMAFSLPPSKRTAEDKGETPASSSDWSKAGSSSSLYASNVLSEDFDTRSRLINVFTQMAYSYPLNLTEVHSSNVTGKFPVNTKGYLVLAVIDPRAPSVDKLFPSNRYKKFNNLKNTFDATKLIGDTFGGKLGVLGKAFANNLAPIGNILKDISSLKVDVHVGESFPTFKIEMHHVKNVFGSVRQHWNEKYPAAQKIFQAPGARSIVKAQHAALYGGMGISAQIGTNYRQKLGCETGAVLGGQDFLELVNYGMRDGKPRMFTYVLMPERLYMSETGPGLLIDMSSKHAMHSNASEEVVYSGELHIRAKLFGNEQRNILVLDNNSGTYAPDSRYLPRLRDVFKLNFLNLEVEVYDFKDPELKRLTAEVKNAISGESNARSNML